MRASGVITTILLISAVGVGYVLGRAGAPSGTQSALSNPEKNVEIQDVPLCEPLYVISFETLADNPALYDGKVISTIAYLTVTDGYATLQPRKDDYLSGVGDLRSVNFMQEGGELLQTLRRFGYRYVVLHGRFSVAQSNRQDERLGSIHVERVAEFLVSDRPESIESVHIHE